MENSQLFMLILSMIGMMLVIIQINISSNNARDASVDKQVSAIDKQIAAREASVDKQIAAIKEDVKAIREDVRDFHNAMDKQITAIRENVKDFHNAMKDVHGRVCTIEEHHRNKE